MEKTSLNIVEDKKITLLSDIESCDDPLINFAKLIFANHFREQYYKSEHSLYDVGNAAHFVRDDGTLIFIQISQCGKLLIETSEETISEALLESGIKNASLFTIYLKDDFQIRTNRMLSRSLFKSYSKITENKLRSSNRSYQVNCNKSTKKVKLMESSKLPIMSQKKNSYGMIEGFNFTDWVSASKTRNYALKDTLIDWLDYWYDKSEEKVRRNASMNNYKSTPSFTSFIMDKGHDFEAHVIELIKQKVKESEFVTICPSSYRLRDNIELYERQTIMEIQKGTPIIYQAFLMNRSGDLSYSYGSPDLLIRSDYLSKLFRNPPLSEEDQFLKAPNLDGNYHYVVVDVKFTTMDLCSDGKRIRNAGSTPAYKCQLYIYNHALGLIQGYEPPKSFILGRKYKYEIAKKSFSYNNCFDRLACIEYNKWDINYVDEAVNAINWIRDLRKNGKEWKLKPMPTVYELYPNMASCGETRWDGFKKQYASDIGEITMIWGCGYKNREIAHNNGVYSFRDKKCSAEALGITGAKNAPIVNQIIKVNNGKMKVKNPLDAVTMSLYDDTKWLEPKSLTITVDFETISNIFDDFHTLPAPNNANYLFMIGVSYKVLNCEPVYKMFMIAELSVDAEYQMINDFYKYLQDVSNKHSNGEIPPLYHWGHIERTFFKSVCQDAGQSIDRKGKLILDRIQKGLLWVDLSDKFRKNLICIEGCFGFGLKEVSNRMIDLDLIKSGWEDNCLGGATAMLVAHQAYSESERTGTPIHYNPIVRNIMLYNKVDVNIIHDILTVIQKKASALGLVNQTNLKKRKRN